MKNIINLSILLILFSVLQCSHNNRVAPELAFKKSFVGIGVRIKNYHNGLYISKVIEGGPADNLPKNIRIKRGDYIIAAGRSKDTIISMKAIEFNEKRKRIAGRIGEKIYLKLSRDLENNKKKIWIAPIVVDEVIYTGEDLLEAKLQHMSTVLNQEIYSGKRAKRPQKLFIRNGHSYFKFDPFRFFGKGVKSQRLI